jgi:hypothetical protein
MYDVNFQPQGFSLRTRWASSGLRILARPQAKAARLPKRGCRRSTFGSMVYCRREAARRQSVHRDFDDSAADVGSALASQFLLQRRRVSAKAAAISESGITGESERDLAVVQRGGPGFWMEPMAGQSAAPAEPLGPRRADPACAWPYRLDSLRDLAGQPMSHDVDLLGADSVCTNNRDVPDPLRSPLDGAKTTPTSRVAESLPAMRV